MNKTNIEWATHTWNPITGCSPASEGCANCYAAGIAKRFKKPWGFPVFHQEKLYDKMPRKPSRIFVNSVSDLFHDGVPFDVVDRILWCVRENPKHTFIILTKRAERMKEYFCGLRDNAPGCKDRILKGDPAHASLMLLYREGKALQNLWLGVSVENNEAAKRIKYLLQTPAAKRLVSFEPLLESITCHRYHFSPVAMCDCALSNIELQMPSMEPDFKEHSACPNCGQPYKTITGLDWVICGPETGPKARPFNPDWARSLRDQCQAAGVPFFFKGVPHKQKLVLPKKNYMLDGKYHFEFPEATR